MAPGKGFRRRSLQSDEASFNKKKKQSKSLKKKIRDAQRLLAKVCLSDSIQTNACICR